MHHQHERDRNSPQVVQGNARFLALAPRLTGCRGTPAVGGQQGSARRPVRESIGLNFAVAGLTVACKPA